MSTEKIAVITDSCSDIPTEWVEKYNLFVLPLIIQSEDGTIYHDGVDIFPDDVYRLQKTQLLRTSTPSGDEFIGLLNMLLDQGYNKAVAVMLSSGLSGTVNHMRIAAEEIRDRGLEVAVFDTFSGSIGVGAIAIMASEYVMNGMSFEGVKQRIRKLITQTNIYFSVDTLEYLVKGGRIGKVTAAAGGLLDIKPILSLEQKEGEIYMAAMVRGHKAIHKKLLQLVKNVYEPGRPYNIMVADGGAPEEGDEIEKDMKELYPDYHLFIRNKLGATLSVYIGSGILGAAIQYID